MENFKKKEVIRRLNKAGIISNKEMIRLESKEAKIEKIEVSKSNGIFYYTGILKKDPKDEAWVIIETTRGEVLRYRKEQIQQRREDTNGADMNGKRNKDL